MPAHTPGPWKVLATTRSRFFGVLRDERKPGKPLQAGDVSIVAARIGSRADAHLIAAAPALLEALEALVQSADALAYDSNQTFADPDIAEARAAIAQAKGESK